MRIQLLSFVSIGALAVAASSSCSNFADTCEGTNTCAADAGSGGESGASGKGGGSGKGGAGGGTSGDGGEGQGADGGAGNAGSGGEAGSGGGNVCDLSAPEAGCEPAANGVFVAPTGNDDDSGDKEAPVATITKGIELAIASGGPIYICNATYEERVVLGDDADDLAIHGGFACPDAAGPWTYVEGERPVVAPMTPGYALEVDLVKNLTITDVEFVAQDGEGDGGSSIAAFVSQSENVALTRVKLAAGLGDDGLDGDRTDFVYPPIDALDGDDAELTEGGQATPYACDSGTTAGGTGGDGGVTPTSGGSGIPDHDGPGGEGGTTGGTCVEGIGKDGTDGPPGDNGGSPTVVGTVSVTGWTPTPASSGDHGASGQGGGGGAGSASGGGGGGGAGACGGAGGGGGTPGGSSIALLSYQSTLVLTGCEFVTADAGDGGDGIGGQAGQKRSEVEPIGGLGADGVSTACDGGNGGRGGDGGAGAGAAGGVSVGIVFTLGVDQAAPVITDPSYVRGAEGSQGLGADGNDGIDGVSQDTLQLD